MDELLIDSSFLYALFNQDDRNHARALQFASQNTANLYVPDVTLPEVTFLIARDGGVQSVAAFLAGFTGAGMKLLCLTGDDLSRAGTIMLDYQDARFDFVDCSIMAISERLKISRVCTFDRRDFSIFRPQHCDYLLLLPE